MPSPLPPRHLLVLLLTVLALTCLHAQLPAQPSTIPALFLSDIHLDPYADPAKVPLLNAAPASEWPVILASPATPSQPQDLQALRSACPVRGTDTPNLLWRSSLAAIHTHAAGARFVTVSGDLLAHQFDCKYRTLLPKATPADYLAFTEKTVRYVVSSLQQALPGIPIYVAMGNNDSGCTDYALAPTHDQFLARIAKIVADALPEPDRPSVLRDFPAGGYFNVPLASVPHTRIISLDDLYLSGKYVTCAGQPDPAPAAAQLAWLQSQLASARAAHHQVWILSHIPPGVDLYSSARHLIMGCSADRATMFLGSDKLADILASNADIIRLALFGHTHSDEIRLLTPTPPTTNNQQPTTPTGVPLKITASITPVNGNRPTFTLARINPATATLADYTVLIASNSTGVNTAWTPEYTYSAAYHQPAFDAASLTQLISSFQADPAGQSPASQAYLRNYFPGDISSIIQFAWPQYSCSMDNDSAQAFAACACKSPPGAP